MPDCEFVCSQDTSLPALPAQRSGSRRRILPADCIRLQHNLRNPLQIGFADLQKDDVRTRTFSNYHRVKNGIIHNQLLPGSGSAGSPVPAGRYSHE